MARDLSPAELANYAARADEARAFAESMREHVLAAIVRGADLDRKIAAMLNKKGLRTRVNTRWTAHNVSNLRVKLGIPRARSFNQSRGGE